MEDEKYQYLFSVENVNDLVLNGVRTVMLMYKLVKVLKVKNFEPNKNLNHTHEGSIGNLCNEEIKEEFSKVFEKFK